MLNKLTDIIRIIIKNFNNLFTLLNVLGLLKTN